MSEKRRDNRGRVLQKGESQRKDNRYQFRYTDKMGKRRTIYSSDLNDLRKKEKEVRKSIENGINYAEGNITVLELVKRYTSLKQGVRYNTKVGYSSALNIIEDEEFGHKKVRDVKMSDAMQWLVKLSNGGKGFSSIRNIRGVVKPAFQMAVKEDVLLKNPFDFPLKDVIVDDSKKRDALNSQQQKIWMNFIKNDKTYSKYYDEFYILLNTGLRVSEFCGLTKKDINLEEKYINIDHQLSRTKDGKYYVEKTKTNSGTRRIPLTDDVAKSLKNIIERRNNPKKEMVVDGYSEFLLLDKNQNPKVALHIENEMRWAMKKYKKLHPDVPLPNVTPHVLRHTYCTNMVKMNTPLKVLQCLMGHSSIEVTSDIYTHLASEDVNNVVQQLYKKENNWI